MRTMSPSNVREAVCEGGPLHGTMLPVEPVCLWEMPTNAERVLCLPEGTEPPPGCKLLGRYTVATGAANRGRLLWEAAE